MLTGNDKLEIGNFSSEINLKVSSLWLANNCKLTQNWRDGEFPLFYSLWGSTWKCLQNTRFMFKAFGKPHWAVVNQRNWRPPACTIAAGIFSKKTLSIVRNFRQQKTRFVYQQLTGGSLDVCFTITQLTC